MAEVPNFEAGQNALAELAQWARDNLSDRNRNEATTRLHLIDRLLFEALGWMREDCISEERINNSYTDYSLGLPSRRFLVEAKREGIYFELPQGFDKGTCSIATLAGLSGDIGQAIDQAIKYCQDRGIPIGAVANGHQLIAFIGSRQDGVPPLQGLALVFASLEDMIVRFRELWDCLSKPGIESFSLYDVLKEPLAYPPPPKLAEQIARYPGFRTRNAIARDLRVLGELVIEDIAHSAEVEEDFLRECYCPSGALSQYALVSREILEARYSLVMQQEAGIDAEALPRGDRADKAFADDVIASAMTRRPIFLVGDVGAGKSIFIKHFIGVVAKDVLSRGIVLLLDFGQEPALAEGLNEFMMTQFQRQLLDRYGIDVEERNFVRGVYHLDLERFSKSIYAPLLKESPSEYRREEIKFLAGRIEDKAAHLRACFNHIARGQNRQIVVFLDNIDQRPFEFQEALLPIAYSLAETWPTTVFASLRPESYYRSRSFGSLSAYQPRVFTIAPPRIDLVVQKRLAYAKTLLGDEGRLHTFPKGLTIDSPTLSTYIGVLEHSFRHNYDLMEFVDNLSGGNVRQALDFVGAFIGSGHVDTSKILQAVAVSGSYTVPLHEFMRAVIFGESEYYSSDASPVANVFDISRADQREHFLLPILLTFLDRSGRTMGEEGYVAIESIYRFAQDLGFEPAQIQYALRRAEAKSLVEKSPQFDEGPVTSYRITTVGAYSATKLPGLFTYVDAVVVDTPILDGEVRGNILDVRSIEDRLARCLIFRGYLDKAWGSLHDRETYFDWAACSNGLAQLVEKIRSRLQPREPPPTRASSQAG